MKELYSFVQWARLCLRTNNEDDVMKIFSFLGKMSVDLVQMKNTISQSEESEIILGTFISEFTFSIRKEFLKSKNDFSTGAYSKCFQSIMKSILSNPESLNEAQDGFKKKFKFCSNVEKSGNYFSPFFCIVYVGIRL